jgi:hypothetical protein
MAQMIGDLARMFLPSRIIRRVVVFEDKNGLLAG